MIEFAIFGSQNLYVVAGLGLISLVMLQLAFWVGGAFSRFRADKKQLKLRLQILEQQLEAAKVNRSLAEGDAGWNGLRSFLVSRLERDSENTVSIYLTPQDRRPLPFYRPGQYLTFSIEFPNEKKPVVRCYSLSDAPNSEYYRCTIKKVESAKDPEVPGLVSSFFCEQLQEGDHLQVKAPAGQFQLNMEDDRPVVLLAGGIGITPLYSMLASIVKLQPHRRAILFMGARNSRQYPLKSEIEELAARHRNVHVVRCFSAPLDSDRLGKDFDVTGWVTMDLLKSTLPAKNFDFYVCGPGSFMSSLVAGLSEWGVPEKKIHTEAFGPSSITSARTGPNSAAYCDRPACKIRFAKSLVEVEFDSELESILEAAEQVGVAIDSGCRAGNCGSCEIAILKGKAKYLKETGIRPPEGHALSCVAMPDGDVEIDA